MDYRCVSMRKKEDESNEKEMDMAQEVAFAATCSRNLPTNLFRIGCESYFRNYTSLSTTDSTHYRKHGALILLSSVTV